MEFVLWLLWRGAIGAVVLSLVTVAYHRLFFRSTVISGPYGVVLLLTVPGGFMLGLTGAMAKDLTEFIPFLAGCTLLFGALLATLPLGVYLSLLCAYREKRGSTVAAALREGLVYTLPTGVWILWACIRGVRLL